VAAPTPGVELTVEIHDQLDAEQYTAAFAAIDRAPGRHKDWADHYVLSGLTQPQVDALSALAAEWGVLVTVTTERTYTPGSRLDDRSTIANAISTVLWLVDDDDLAAALESYLIDHHFLLRCACGFNVDLDTAVCGSCGAQVRAAEPTSC
jgi:hypothetical protein